MAQQNPRRQSQAIRTVLATVVAFVTTCAVVVVLVVCRAGVSRACKVDRKAGRAADASGRPRAIILLIGDGMGEAQRTAARWQAVGQSGQLAMDAMPVSGWSCTGSADSSVTDSAAAATALATGVKTNNGMISIDPYSNTLTTILEQAQARGMAVGLVTTVQMAHATPAAFASHVSNRNLMTEIASQMMDHQVDVLLGGGEDEFLPGAETGCYPQAGERMDGRNLVDEAVAVGYTYVCTPTAFAAVPVTTTHLLGLFADEGMTRPFSPTLAQMTQEAVDILSQDPQGFFLMVEGGQIDWACHDNDAANAISDTIGFDEAVAVAQDYASLNPNTLVIVTGDHETGGMSVTLNPMGSLGEDGPFRMPDDTPFYVNWTTGGHTSANVPTTAQGAFSSLLAGTDENTLIHDVMYELVEPDIWLPLVLHGGKE
jgi:alkaline phosphatase